MAELEDALDLGSSRFTPMRVRVSLLAPNLRYNFMNDNNIINVKKKNTSYNFIITINHNILKKEEEKYTKKLSKNLSINGFRKGKIPTFFIYSKFFKEITNHAQEKIIQNEINNYFKKSKLKIINIQNIKKNDNDKANNKYEHNFIIHAFPEISLETIKNLEVEMLSFSIQKNDIDNFINQIRKKHSQYHDVSKKYNACINDKITIDYIGYYNSNSINQLTKKNLILNIGSFDDSNIPNIDKYLIGSTINQEKKVVIKMPKNFYITEYQEKEISFFIKINNIKKCIIPQYNKEFIKSTGYSENIINNIMKKKCEEIKKNTLFYNIINKLIDKKDIPNILVEKELSSLGINKINSINEKYKEYLDNMIRDKIASAFVLNEIKEKFNIIIDEKDYNTVKDFKNNKQKYEEMKNFIIETKIFNHLKQYINKITIKNVLYKDYIK